MQEKKKWVFKTPIRLFLALILALPCDSAAILEPITQNDHGEIERLKILYCGVQCTENQEIEEALSHFEQVISTAPQSVEACKAHYLVLQLYEKRGDRNGADLHRKALFTHFKHHPLTEEVMIVQEIPKRFFVSHLLEMEKLYPGSPFLALLWYKDALTLIDQKQYREAVDQLERAEDRLRSSPLDDHLLKEVVCKKVETLLNWSTTCKGAKKSCNLKLAGEAIDTLPLDGETAYLRARQQVESCELEKARLLLNEEIGQILRQGVTKSAQLAKAYQLMSYIDCAHGETEAAIAHLRLALAAISREPLQLSLYMELSELLEEKEDYEGSIHALSSLINAPIVSALRLEAMQKRALLWERLGRDDLAKLQRGDYEHNPSSIPK